MALNNKTVFITGATRGIGSAIARLFKEQNFRVVGTGTKEVADGHCDEFFIADFTDPDQLSECVNFMGRLKPDVLINNAGININAPFTEIDIQEFQRMQQVNVVAPLLLCQAAIPGMKQRGWGRIVNISSIWGKISKENRAAYSASKFAIDGITLALSIEYARHGILANCIAPGFTDTELTRSTLGSDALNQILAIVPIGRMANVAEIAKFVVWLAGVENTYITGQNIAIDGGFTRA